MESPFLQAHGLPRYIGLFLSGVCGQLPEHSLFLAGVQTPLCARCTGTYLGALLGLCNYWLKGRSRASRLPPPSVLVIQGLFFFFGVIDGLNSYLQFFSGVASIYPPHNSLRLLAGLLNGLALSLLIVPMFNFIFWQRPDSQRVVRGLGELGGMLVQILVLGSLLLSGIDVLLYPLFLVDIASVLLVLTLVNSMIVVILLHRENQAKRWIEALLPLGLGFLLSIMEVGGLAWVRSLLAGMLPPLTL